MKPLKTLEMTCKHKWMFENRSEGKKACRKCGKKLTVKTYK